uniref:suppressor protein SRP40-like isoform X2 n=1 Tax=Erigeron canadensis TaxID=72917 RepID=UPI001CB8C270|nr:suppressor protein SRP40-like isoform X2 [Erigeron canadensis]
MGLTKPLNGFGQKLVLRLIPGRLLHSIWRTYSANIMPGGCEHLSITTTKWSGGTESCSLQRSLRFESCLRQISWWWPGKWLGLATGKNTKEQLGRYMRVKRWFTIPCNADGSKNTSKKPVFGQDKPIDYDNVYPTNEEPTTKKKKKKGTTESENGGIVDHSEVIDTKMVESDTKRVEEPELKPKKKKTKHDLCSSGLAEVKMDTANESKIDDSTKKTKEKKITIMQEDKLMPSTSNDNEIATDDGEKERKIKKKKSTTDGAVKDTKMVESDTKKVEEPELKPKKKKTKHDLYSSSQAEVKMDMTNELKLDDLTKKTTEKKKTSMQEDKLMPSTSNDNEVATDVGEKERKNKKKKSGAVKDAEADIVKMDAGSENMSSKEKKSSKKRKRDENENSSNEVTISEESKCQKTQTFKEEKSKKEEINLQETSKNQLDGQSNGKLETNGGEISIAKKSTKKQRNVTNEPKTVNAFQRVKVDQVEFADEKLQDNSYWAKDGADIGYGAKAQEVLGQVRGRDFRHEKTKKKRGSYRGGSIDLQSHSIKFNYSDGE